MDEDWFVTIHVCIEDAASGAMTCKKISQCDENSSEKEILKLLKQIAESMQKVNSIFLQEYLRNVIPTFITIVGASFYFWYKR